MAVWPKLYVSAENQSAHNTVRGSADPAPADFLSLLNKEMFPEAFRVLKWFPGPPLPSPFPAFRQAGHEAPPLRRDLHPPAAFCKSLSVHSVLFPFLHTDNPYGSKGGHPPDPTPLLSALRPETVSAP